MDPTHPSSVAANTRVKAELLQLGMIKVKAYNLYIVIKPPCTYGLYSLVAMCVTLPIILADCKRIFSAIRQVKKKLDSSNYGERMFFIFAFDYIVNLLVKGITHDLV